MFSRKPKPMSDDPQPSDSFLHTHRFALLLLGLVVLFFYGAAGDLIPQEERSLGIRVLLGLILAYMIIAATFAVGGRGRSFWFMGVLAVPAVVFQVLDAALLRADTQVLGHGFGMLFIGAVILRLLRLVFQSQCVTNDTIFASLCVYLLLATFWMYVYSLIELKDPGAFSYSQTELAHLTQKEEGLPLRVMRLGAPPAGIEFYFSVVTMTTLGYGDILPVSPAARSAATLQAVLGQLYLAVLVARLVGLHVAESARRE